MHSIQLTINEENFSADLSRKIISGNLNIVDLIEKLLEQYLHESLESVLFPRLIKPVTVVLYRHSFRDRFATLKTLSESGYDTWYLELKFITKDEDSIPAIKVIPKGFQLVKLDYGFGVKRDFDYKITRLKTQTNHRIRLNHVILPPSLFHKTLNKLLAENRLEQPYVANLGLGDSACFTPLVSFDHVLTNERLFCACAKNAHMIILEESLQQAPQYSADSWPHKLISLLEPAKYQENLCHLCLSDKYGSDIAKKRYGDAIKTYFKPYVHQLVLSENFDARTSRADVQQRLGISRWRNESALYQLIKELFPNFSIQREASPPWLEKQRLDIYIPELNLAIEFQGQQHFEAVNLFGGNEGLAKTIQRDKQKRLLCESNGVNLVEIRYDESLSLAFLRQRLKKYLLTTRS